MEIRGINGQLIHFEAQDKVGLDGFLVRPRNAKTCLIYIHGWGSNFYRTLATNLIKGVSENGIAIFSINTRGHDNITRLKRTSGKRKDQFLGGSEFERFEDSVFDISGAIKSMRKFGFREFILCGHSTGCQKITYYQYKKNDKSVKGLILIAPGDDYSIWKEVIPKQNFNEKVRLAKKLVANGKGDEWNFVEGASPRRFLSVADPKNVEARLFNYDGKLSEFSKIKVPILAIFGTKEEHALKPVKKYLEILEKKTNSRLYISKVIKGAGHLFIEHETELSKEISDFVSRS